MEGEEKEMERKKGNVLFNDAINTFYLQLYGVGYLVKGHSARKRKTPLPLIQGLHFQQQGFFYMHHSMHKIGESA